ncbi:MAG TPA: DUF3107 domain-containing protein [Mycobacteriales bacterium]|nr:DUF3107 domain-containing protein [Mycobacteriales bacterium]
MEVKIGVQFGARELVIDSAETPDAIQAALDAALVKGGLFALVDEKGRRVVVPVDKLAYVEIASADETRAVGFSRL